MQGWRWRVAVHALGFFDGRGLALVCVARIGAAALALSAKCAKSIHADEHALC